MMYKGNYSVSGMASGFADLENDDLNALVGMLKRFCHVFKEPDECAAFWVKKGEKVILRGNVYKDERVFTIF